MNIQQRKIKIVSDGTRKGTAVLDAATGEQIDGVTHVEITLNAMGEMKAVITIVDPLLDVTINADVKHK